jgi:hypothetical protein
MVLDVVGIAGHTLSDLQVVAKLEVTDEDSLGQDDRVDDGDGQRLLSSGDLDNRWT